MTTLNLTSGQILDIIKILEQKEEYYEGIDDLNMANYYWDMKSQFSIVYEKLQDRPGEKREAVLVLADY